MIFSRRQLLLAGVGLSMARMPNASALPLRDAPPYRPQARSAIQGTLLGLTTQAPGNRQREVSSVIRLDLSNGDMNVTELDGHRFGHSLVPLPDGGFFSVPYGDDDVSCLFLDEKLQIRGELKPPARHGFAGHAVLMPDQRHLFVHFNQSGYSDQLEIGETGTAALVDRTTMKVMKTIDSGIHHGHDMLVSRDGKFIVVGDDGILASNRPPDPLTSHYPYSLSVHDPALVAFPLSDLTQPRRYSLDLQGCLVHLTEDQDHRVIGAVEQYVADTVEGRAILSGAIQGSEQDYLAMLDRQSFKSELPLPGPIVSVDLNDGSIERTVRDHHQAPFDIGVNEVTGSVVSLFTGSHTLARHLPSKNQWDYLSTKHWGIEQPRGIADIPGTDLMIVNGFWSGVAVFNVRTLAPVALFTDPLFGVKHLTYLPS